MRRVTMRNPFTGGMVTDLAASDIGPTNSAFAQDGYSPQGTFKQRAGWAYDGTTADVADNLVGVYRAQFALADVTRTVTIDDDGDTFIHNASSAGTSLEDLSEVFLPRAVYRDQLILCAIDGDTPMRLYSGGANASRTYSSGSPTFTANKATISGTNTFASTTPTVGEYVTTYVDTAIEVRWNFRILEATSDDSITLEDLVANTTNPLTSVTVGPFATAAPCVSVYSAGTAVVSAGTATGTGTKWSTGNWGTVVANSDAILPLVTLTGTSNYRLLNVSVVTNDTSLTVAGASATEGAHHILRRCPFKDVADHKESLWGTGVIQYPNRVYVSPPGWNPLIPPGKTAPIDGFSTALISENANDFMLDYIDVPSPYDGDHNVAILSSPNHLWVLKREKAYGIHGSFGGLDVSRDPIGPGCIDIRSAITVAEGNFWASEDDVFWAMSDTAEPLMAGKIAREWRALTRDFDYGTSDYVSCGVASGHLFVHITTNGGQTQRTYLCDLRDRSWQSRISNVTPRYMFTSRIPGEKEKLLAVSDARQGRVLDLAPTLDRSGTADDDAGTAPLLQAYSPEIGADGVEGVTRLVDIAVHANVYDAGAAGSTNMNVSVVSQGGIGNPASSTKTLTDIQSDTTDNTNRHHRRVARDGRLHQVRFDVDATGTDTTATKVEIDQIDMFLRDGRMRSR